MYQKKIYLWSTVNTVILMILYKFNYIVNIKSILSDVIAFNAAVFSFLMVFFTVLQGASKTELFIKMEKFREHLLDDIFKQIKYLLFWSMFLFVYILIIKMLIIPYVFIKIIGIFVLFFSISNLCLGLYYLIDDIYDAIAKSGKDSKEK